MEVRLINAPRGTERLTAIAARLCYSNKTGSELIRDLNFTEVDRLNNKLLSLGHFSPFEHAHFTFSIEGISRVCSHQLVRHRIANYSQKSQRYNRETSTEMVIPKSLENIGAKKMIKSWEQDIISLYNTLVATGVPEEDARYILPQGIETNLIMTMNIRSLFNFFYLRLCKSSQWEIRELAEKMLELCKTEAPNIFENASPCYDCSEVCNND